MAVAKGSRAAGLMCVALSLCSPGVLPEGQNSPQKVKYDLYAEGVRAADAFPRLLQR